MFLANYSNLPGPLFLFQLLFGHPHYPSGKIIYKEYYPSEAKPIIDEIDRVLAQHYGLTDEELDFIINYDIKYRMGAEDDSEE